ncbi:MAG: asparagine synthase (glutamine-hydrolyzing) [Syntrophobacteraceae bacterium]|nr:asparagine synthase (glutamine-hydrolyzing) [Syntrophobacteraceae bacterium]
MCGLCGIVHWDGQSADEGLVRRMNGLIRHRGPDDEGYHLSGGVGLGFRRLSIIDLAGGAQPMPNEDGSVHVVFNGEIYNFKDLRKTLTQRGHAFRTRSDTEVIVHGYEEWGEDVVSSLQGMFAFALWDETRRTLFLARDRLGIKPLYYGILPGALVFGSEPKCLLEAPGIDRSLNDRAVLDYFSFLYIPTRQRIYRGIRQLMPGESLTLSQGAVSLRRYWTPRWRLDRTRTEEEWCEALREQLDRSVSSHLVADVPVGVWLSGGIDSSAVAASMTRAGPGRALSFSAGFDVPRYDETRYALEVSRHLGTSHEVLPMDSSSMEILPRLLWLLDEPLADATVIPTYLLSRRTRERVKVVLSGEGGDELFGGYTHYQGMELNRCLRSVPAPLRRWMAEAIHGMRRRAGGTPLYRWHRLERVLESSLSPPFEDFLGKVAAFSGKEIACLFSMDFLKEIHDFVPMEPMREAVAMTPSPDPLSSAFLADLSVYLHGDMLTKVDRMSMACSLEVRVPLLDHDLVELALAIPSGLKVRGMETKGILRGAVSPWLPRRIARRPKRGFNPPLEHWLRGSLPRVVADWGMLEALRDAGMFRMGYVRALMEEHVRGQGDHARKLWALLVFAVWWRRVRGGKGGCP